MPKNSQLKVCVRCKEQPARAGICGSYYVLRDGRKPSHLEPQLKGSFRARGYCSECFLKLAEQNEIGEVQLKRLRRRLKE
jgi:hypothetical protein